MFHNDIQTKNIGRQTIIYDKYFRPILNESKWFAILDLDEFLYSPNDIHLPNIIEKYYHGIGTYIGTDFKYYTYPEKYNLF